MKKALIIVWSLLMAVAMQAQLNGKFSVSSSKQVRFSKGNLVYNCTSKSFSFASTQYAVIGTANSTNIANKSGSIDLFGWGTSGYNDCMPYETSLSVKYGGGNSSIAGTQYDWGVKNFSGYRTLTNSEWSYIFSGRTNASSLRGPATVNNVKGWILLPDSWSQPSSITFKSTADGGNSYSSNVYTTTQFSTMESAGAVFLPAAGWRYSSGSASVTSYVNSQGYYWTANSGTAVNFMGSYCASGQDAANYSGCAVRLVKDGSGGGGGTTTQYTISTKVDPAGAGTVTGAGVYNRYDYVTIQAYPNAEWEFVNFTATNYPNSSTNNPWRYPAEHDNVITAHFQQKTYPVYAEENDWHKGTVEPSSSVYPKGTTITFTATPKAGCRFVKWSDGVTSATRTYTVKGTENNTDNVVIFRAEFESVSKFTLTPASAQPEMGTVSAPVTVDAGTNAKATAYPKEGYKFVNWTLSNTTNKRTDNPLGTYLYENVTATANFAVAQNVTITVLAEPTNGGIVSGGGSYPEQTTVQLSATPNDGMKFVRWEKQNSNGNWSSVSTNANYSFKATADATYRAVFETAKTYSVSVTVDETQGSVTITPDKDFYYEGDTVKLEAFPAECYKFVSWDSYADASFGSIWRNPYYFIVTKDYDLYATFEPSYTELIVNTVSPAWGNVRIVDQNDNPFESRVVHQGCPNTQVTVEAKPERGYTFHHWSDGSKENPHTVTIVNDENSRMNVMAYFNYTYLAYYCGDPVTDNMALYADFYDSICVRGKGNMKTYDIENNLTTAPWKTSYNNPDDNYILVIEDSVEYVGYAAFCGMKGIKKVYIESSVFYMAKTNSFANMALDVFAISPSTKHILNSALRNTSIKRLILCGPTPPLNEPTDWFGVFYNKDIDKSIVACIPAGSREAYRSYEQSFGSVQEWYNINIEVEGDGVCTVDKRLYPIAGDTVSLHVKAGEGLVARIRVTDELGNHIKMDENYRFVMPASHVTVKATFETKYEFNNMSVSVTKNTASLSWNVSPQPAYVKIAIHWENEEIYSESLNGLINSRALDFSTTGTYQWFLTALDANKQPLSDPAEGPVIVISQMQGIEDLPESETDAPRKILIDGVIYILRGEKVYTIQGQEVQ